MIMMEPASRDLPMASGTGISYNHPHLKCNPATYGHSEAPFLLPLPALLRVILVLGRLRSMSYAHL